MKVVISSSGPGMESRVDERFGRCPYFMLVEIESGKIKSHKTIENASIKQETGAGTTAAQLVADMGVDAIITGNMGPRAFQVFEQLGIEVYEARGKVGEAVEDFIEGRLERMESARCPRH